MLLAQCLLLGVVSLQTCFGKIIGDQTQTWMNTRDFPLTFSYTFKIWHPEAANKEREITIDVEYDAITTAERRLSACLSIASAPLNQTGVPEPFWITGAKQSWIGEGEKKLFATNYVSAHASRTSCDEEGVKRCDLPMGKTQPGSWSSFKCKGATDGMVNVKGGTLKRPEGVPSQAYAAWGLGFIGPEDNEVNWYNGVKN